MEKTISNHKIICDSRKMLQLTGVEKVESSNENQIICIAMKSPLVISGKNMHVKKLDVQQGVVEVEGNIDSIRYQPERKSFLKRIFK